MKFFTLIECLLKMLEIGIKIKKLIIICQKLINFLNQLLIIIIKNKNKKFRISKEKIKIIKTPKNDKVSI